MSKESRECAEGEGITVTEAPIESPSTMSHVERYHAPLRAAYLKIRESLSRTTKEERLQLAVKAVNDTVGPEGLCPTLLVFGTLPRPARIHPAATQLERAKAKGEATKEFHKEISKRKIAFAKKHTHSPKGKASNAEIHKLPAGAPVRVWRESLNSWEGPFPFISIDGETVIVQLPHGRKLFRSTVIKPVNGSGFGDNLETAEKEEPLTETQTQALFGQTKVRIASKKEAHKFKTAREEELHGLIEGKIFEVVKRDSVPKGKIIYGTRFIDAVKTVDNNTKLKSRLVAQNYMDEEATTISTTSPTIQRAS